MRMPDPNAPECDCGVLERLSKEPGVPIIYDPELNEYHIQTPDGGRNMMMHHCFFCGGRLPKSRCLIRMAAALSRLGMAETIPKGRSHGFPAPYYYSPAP